MVISKYDRQKKRKYDNARLKAKPWLKTLMNIRNRCGNEKRPYYLKKGIKCLLSIEDIKKIYFRDKPFLMKRPTIDRIDNDGNYILKNCQYIELEDNLKKRYVGKWSLKFSCCQYCGTIKSRHMGEGLCCGCYLRKYRYNRLWRVRRKAKSKEAT